MQLKNRLLHAFSANIILLIIVGLSNTFFMINSRSTLESLSQTIISSEKHINSIRLNINRIYGEILSLMIYDETRDSTGSIDELAVTFYRETEYMEDIFPEDTATFAEIRDNFREFYLYGKWLLGETDSTGLKERPDTVKKFRELEEALIMKISDTVDRYETIHLKTFDKINRNASFALIFSLIAVISGVFLSFIISILLSRSIARPVLSLTETLSEVERGNFKVHSDIKSSDELGTMAKAVNKMSGELEIRFTKMTYLKSLLHSILDSVDSVVIAVDEDNRISHWNHNAVLLTDIETKDSIGKLFGEVFPHEILKQTFITPVLEEKKQQIIQKKSVFFRNQNHYFNISAYPHKNIDLKGAVLLIQDITEQVMLEDVMVQSEKMLSVGGLAAGMAHEINNPLAGMIQTANVMSKRLGNSTSLPANIKAAEEAGTNMEAIAGYTISRGIPRMLESINRSGKQISEIVDNMLSFSRKDDNRKSSHDMEELIDKTIKLAESDYDLKKSYDFRQIKIIRDYGGNLPPVLCESSKIQQVILNLLRNGAQAMQEQGSGGHLFTIRTKALQMRKMISIDIEDNGPGMDNEVRKRVFEPFFTTKPEGVGTGLGLSVSYFIITDTHKGEMSVRSEKGAGTVFTINLPV